MIQRIVLLLAYMVVCVRCGSNTETQLFSDCVPSFEQGTAFEVVTLDLENFPKQNNSIMHTAEMLLCLNADVVALQKISNEGALAQLVSLMKGWDYVMSPEADSGSSLAFLFKISEVELISDNIQVLENTESNFFARAPLQIKVRHRPSEINTYLINVDLKRREEPTDINRSSETLNQFKSMLDNKYKNDYVAVLGEFNESSDEGSKEEDFWGAFMNDSLNYRIVGKPLVRSSVILYSYFPGPDVPEPIIISNEWFEGLKEVVTICPDECYCDYENTISNYRPVVAVFNP